MSNLTKEVNQILFKQIEDESFQSLMWILSTINRSLIQNSEMSLSEFQRDIKTACPDFFEAYQSIMDDKNLKRVG